MGHPTHHHLVRLEGPLVADTSLCDHDPQAMALVSLPHADIAFPPGEEPEWGQNRSRHDRALLCALPVWLGLGWGWRAGKEQ